MSQIPILYENNKTLAISEAVSKCLDQSNCPHCKLDTEKHITAEEGNTLDKLQAHFFFDLFNANNLFHFLQKMNLQKLSRQHILQPKLPLQQLQLFQPQQTKSRQRILPHL